MDRYPSPRQTQSYLRNLLAERGIHPKNKLGQNFLVDLNLLDLLVRSADLTADDLALEVGSGTGSLTVRLAAEAGAVVSVEIDPDFARMTEEAVGRQEHVYLLHTDILKNKNELNPDVLRAINDLRMKTGVQRIKLVANLPYAVAVPVISNLLLSDFPVQHLVGTVQWEIAERLTARPGTKDYGALAVLVQSVAEVSIIRKIGPAAFWPRPQVNSAIVLVQPDPDRRAQVGDVERFRYFLRDLYVHRRKNLRGALVGFPTREFSKTEVDQKLADLGIAGTTRAEDLDIAQHLRLCAAFG
jgi:16S rRNA (adenine1518-N6/adenine1519-N6)-dimethyltransferase